MKLRENEKIIKDYQLFKQFFSFFGLVKKNVNVKVSNYRIIFESNVKTLFGRTKKTSEIYLDGVSKISFVEHNFLNIFPIFLFIAMAGAFAAFLVLFILEFDEIFLVLFIVFAALMVGSLFLIIFMPRIRSFGLSIFSKHFYVPSISVSNCFNRGHTHLKFTNVKPILSEENGYEVFLNDLSTYLNTDVVLEEM